MDTKPETIPPEERTLDKAFELFTLKPRSKGSLESATACGASLLSWVHGDPFSDRLDCAHRLLNDLMISAFDAGDTTDEQRHDLVRSGLTGLLDTWDIPDSVVAAAVAATDATVDENRAGRAVATFNAITWWKHDKQRANLRDADLRGADLRDANLRDADLRGANLRDANLRDADLRDADLRDADLRDADLRGANLWGADLRGANLWDANANGFTTLPGGWTFSGGRIVKAGA